MNYCHVCGKGYLHFTEQDQHYLDAHCEQYNPEQRKKVDVKAKKAAHIAKKKTKKTAWD